VNLPDNIPKFRQWISKKSWDCWRQVLEHDIEIMTTVSPCAADSGWYLDVLKAASVRRSHKRVEEMWGECDGTALEEMLNEEQVTPLVYMCCY